MFIKLYPEPPMLTTGRSPKLVFSKSKPVPPEPKSWQDYKSSIISLITIIDALYGTIDYEWLPTYYNQLIMHHRANLEDLRIMLQKLEAQMRHVLGKPL